MRLFPFVHLMNDLVVNKKKLAAAISDALLNLDIQKIFGCSLIIWLILEAHGLISLVSCGSQPVC